MRWNRGHRSSNLEDRRGQRAPLGGGAGGGGLGLLANLLPLAARFGWKGILVAVLLGGALLAYQGGFFGGGTPAGDDRSRLQGGGGGPTGAVADEKVAFVGFVFDDAQTFWQREFQQAGARYREANIVVFTGAVESACGRASSQVGPFYCPGDQQVFIDLAFYAQLRDQLGAPGDFAEAYVLAHEVAHHVQALTGALDHADSVATELQADCLAGVWAKDASRRSLLEIGDLEEALTAASSIGDDVLAERAGGRVRPESFTHGSAKQRYAALRRGYDAGAPSACELRLR